MAATHGAETGTMLMSRSHAISSELPTAAMTMLSAGM